MTPPLLEGLLHDGIGHLLGGAGRDGRFDKYEGAGPDVLRYDAEGLLQGGHVGCALAAVAEPLLQIVALDVHHDDVGQTESLLRERSHEGLLLVDASCDHRSDFRILRCHRRDAPVHQRDLPVAAGAGPLHPYDELARRSVRPGRVRHDCGHHGSYESEPHHGDDLPAPGTVLLDEPG